MAETGHADWVTTLIMMVSDRTNSVGDLSISFYMSFFFFLIGGLNPVLVFLEQNWGSSSWGIS